MKNTLFMILVLVSCSLVKAEEYFTIECKARPYTPRYNDSRLELFAEIDVLDQRISDRLQAEIRIKKLNVYSVQSSETLTDLKDKAIFGVSTATTSGSQIEREFQFEIAPYLVVAPPSVTLKVYSQGVDGYFGSIHDRRKELPEYNAWTYCQVTKR